MYTFTLFYSDEQIKTNKHLLRGLWVRRHLTYLIYCQYSQRTTACRVLLTAITITQMTDNNGTNFISVSISSVAHSANRWQDVTMFAGDFSANFLNFYLLFSIISLCHCLSANSYFFLLCDSPSNMPVSPSLAHRKAKFLQYLPQRTLHKLYQCTLVVAFAWHALQAATFSAMHL